MGSTQTEDHDTAEPWLVGGRAPGAEEASVVDRDVAGAVGRVLDRVLAERTARAREVHPLFGDDVAGRVVHPDVGPCGGPSAVAGAARGAGVHR